MLFSFIIQFSHNSTILPGKKLVSNCPETTCTTFGHFLDLLDSQGMNVAWLEEISGGFHADDRKAASYRDRRFPWFY